MFADIELAVRIDRSEADMCSGAAAMIQQRRPEARVITLPLAGGTAVFTTPQSPLNKVIGLGLQATFDPAHLAAELDAIEAAWRDRNEDVRIEISSLANPDVLPLLSARGYVLHGFEDVLGRRLAEVKPAVNVNGISIELLREADAKAWTDIAVSAFTDLDGTGAVADDPLSRELLENVFADIAGAPGFTRYLARFHGEPAAVGSMRIDAGLALIAGSGTLTPFRGNGLQKALIAHRLNLAREQRCTWRS
jgi:hypothetical protein